MTNKKLKYMNRDNNTSKDLGSQQHQDKAASVASHTSTVGNSIEQLRKAIVEIDKLRIKAVSNQQDDIYNDLITIQTRVFIAMDLIAPAPTTAPTQIEGVLKWLDVRIETTRRDGRKQQSLAAISRYGTTLTAFKEIRNYIASLNQGTGSSEAPKQ